VFAPAKINLGLRVTGVRPDGYHELDSIFLPLDVGDDVELAESDTPGVRLELAQPAEGVPTDQRNLAVRAAEAFQREAGLSTGLDIRLTKRVPAAAGLGGGSSDAATVLRVLDQLHPGAVAPEQLRSLALGLGADVPWFLDPQPARVRGVGERIEPLAGFPELAVLLANPGIPLSTAEVYRAADALGRALTGPDAGPTLRPLAALREAEGRLERVDPEEIARWVANDLEAAATRLCPPIARLRARLLEAGARVVGLSGSGPTLYGLFPDRAAASRTAKAAKLEAPIWFRVAETRAAL
jgi:4-diphosphocytidyl-2-C-methyl-D-erythritol kinase